MRCPRCTSTEDRVIDSRVSKDGASIRRRRECIACDHRYSTTETIVREGLVVIKRDSRREEFDRAKLFNGLRKACEKRPIDLEQLNMLVEDVIDAIEARYDCEVPSRAIGEEAMERIRRIDPIAYVRFASVYKDFRDINELMADVSTLDGPARP